MRRSLALVLTLILFPPFLNSGEKPKEKPVVDEMRDAMNSMRQEIAELEKELAEAKAKKRFEDVKDLEQLLERQKQLLSMMGGALTSVEKMPAADRQKIEASLDRKFPQKDTARIAKVPKRILSDVELKSLIPRIHTAVERKIDPKFRALMPRVYEKIKTKYSSSTAVANAGSGWLLMRVPEGALWLMGKACMEAPNPDNLNNYAAFLVMAGAEEAALPILMKLNQQFPNNSTILNNIGQAWFGLGDLEEAEKHLKEAIRFFAYHSQANYTMCLIEESKGNKGEAIAALKRSIKRSYTSEKENKLRRLGGGLKNNDISWNLRMPEDPLGLQKFNPPPYARSVESFDALAPEWAQFRKNCRDLLDNLKVQEKVAMAEVAEVQKKREKLIREGKQYTADLPKIKPTTEAILRWETDQINQSMNLGMTLTPLGMKAMRKAQLSVSEGHYQREKAKNDAEFQRIRKEIERLSKQVKDEQARISRNARGGEGDTGGLSEEQICAEKEAAKDRFIASANAMLKQVQASILTTELKQINEETYWRQFTEDDATFQLTKNRAKQKFLNQLLSLYHATPGGEIGETVWVPGYSYACKKKPVKPSTGKLQDFDDLHCEHKIDLDMILVKGEFTCNKAILKYNVILLQGEHVENLNTGKVIRGEVEIGISMGEELELGPVKAEAKAGVGAFLEYDENGVADFGPQVVAKVELSSKFVSNPAEVKLAGGKIEVGEIPSLGEAGIRGRLGWNSGPRVEGVGVLKGLEF